MLSTHPGSIYLASPWLSWPLLGCPGLSCAPLASPGLSGSLLASQRLFGAVWDWLGWAWMASRSHLLKKTMNSLCEYVPNWQKCKNPKKKQKNPKNQKVAEPDSDLRGGALDMTPWHRDTMTPWHRDKVSRGTVSRCHGVTVSRCHGVTVSLCHSVTVSRCHGVTVSCLEPLPSDQNLALRLFGFFCFLGFLGFFFQKNYWYFVGFKSKNQKDASNI